jgi:general secretion pathway protein G
MFACLLALLLTSLPPQTPAPTPTTAPATAESLIPANALAVVRLRSLDAIDQAAQSIMPGTKVGDQILGLLPMATQAPMAADQVDHTSPIILAAVPSQVRPPVELMLILTCKDPAVFTAPLEKMGWNCTTSGKIVACSPSKPGPSLAADAPMRMGLDKNDVVIRIAMEETMSQFGELLHSQLDQAAQAAETAMPDKKQGENVSSMITGLSDALDEIEIFEIHLSQHGDQTRLGFEMTALDGSDLAKVEKVDVSALPTAARVLDDGGAMSMLIAMDFSKIMATFQGLMDAAAVAMPEEQRSSFTALMNMSKELYSSMGTTVAGSFDFGADGMRGAYYLQAKDPAAYMTKMIELLKTGIPWMPITKTDHSTVDGVDVTTYHFTIDTKAIPMAGASPVASTPEAQAEIDKGMQAMFGPGGMQFSIAAANGGLISVVGDVGQMKGALARVSSKSPGALGAELLKEMGGLNPGIVFRMDLGRYMANMGTAFTAMAGEGQPEMTQALDMFRSMPPIQMVGGVEGRVWKLGISTNVAKFVASAMQMKAMAARSGAKNVAAGSTRMKARADIAGIVAALDSYAMNNGGKYPDTLEALVTPDMNGKRYLEMQKLPLDPWGHAYVYMQPKSSNEHPRVSSLGADGRVGGTGDSADIDNESQDGDDH